MKESNLYQLEEHVGYIFFVEHVNNISSCYWFRIHMKNGATHNVTISFEGSIEEAKKEVVESFKQYLDGGKYHDNDRIGKSV